MTDSAGKKNDEFILRKIASFSQLRPFFVAGWAERLRILAIIQPHLAVGAILRGDVAKIWPHGKALGGEFSIECHQKTDDCLTDPSLYRPDLTALAAAAEIFQRRHSHVSDNRPVGQSARQRTIKRSAQKFLA